MGSLSHDRAGIDTEDRLLSHLQVAIVQQFPGRRRSTLSWLDPSRGVPSAHGHSAL